MSIFSSHVFIGWRKAQSEVAAPLPQVKASSQQGLALGRRKVNAWNEFYHEFNRTAARLKIEPRLLSNAYPEAGEAVSQFLNGELIEAICTLRRIDREDKCLV